MEIKIGQLAIQGKITGRRETTVDGKQYYHLELTTPSQYPAVLDLWTADPTVAAANVPDFAVGKDCIALVWVNGRKQTTFKDKTTGEVRKLKFPQYRVSIRLAELTACESQQTQSQVNDDSDIPF